MRRIRADKQPRMGPVLVLSGKYKADIIARLGLDPSPAKDCFISVPISEAQAFRRPRELRAMPADPLRAM